MEVLREGLRARGGDQALLIGLPVQPSHCELELLQPSGFRRSKPSL